MKQIFFKKSLAVLLSLVMVFGNMGFVKANQITNQDTINQEDKSKLKEKILPKSINDKFEIYLDDRARYKNWFC